MTQTLHPSSGYMAWCWADDEEMRKKLKHTLDVLSDGSVSARGLYLFHPEKLSELKSLRSEFDGSNGAGVVVIVYDEQVT